MLEDRTTCGKTEGKEAQMAHTRHADNKQPSKRDVSRDDGPERELQSGEWEKEKGKIE